MRLSRIVYALAVLLFTASSTYAQVIYYLYDDLGRLSLASFPDGSVVLYSYDANGNRELALQYGAPTPVIESFFPSSGQAGVSVTIDGAGFSATLALNAVTIGGISATVTSALETELVVTVPLGAATGPIAVSTGGPATSSLENFTVLTPVISGFSPVLVNPQDDVTIQGQNFNLVPGQTAVSVGGVAANIRSITNGSLVIDATSASGQILIDTPYGDALSAGSLIVVPSAIDPEDVVDTSVIAVNGSANLQMAQQSGYGVLEFAGTSGQWLRVRVTSLQTSPGSAPVNYAVYSPSGTSIAAGSFTSTTLVPIFLPKLTATGTHYIAFYSATSSLTDMSIALDPYPVLPTNGTTVSAQTTQPNEFTYFTFDATAGDDLSLAITGISVNPGTYVSVSVYRPSGSTWISGDMCSESSNPGCSIELRNASQTGTYRVRVGPYTSGGIMSFNATMTHNVAGGQVSLDTVVPVSLPILGQRAEYTFVATAGQTVAVHVGSLVMTPSNAPVNTRVLDPAGVQISSGTQKTFDLENLAAGTHIIILSPNAGATGTMNLIVASGVTITVLPDGTEHVLTTTVPDQSAYIRFGATVGDDFYLALTGIAVTGGSNVYMTVHRPSGSYLISGTTCSETPTAGCSYDLANLTQNGTYKVTVFPYSATGAISFTATLSQPLNVGTLALNTPVAVNIASYGQRATATFTATAGQNIALQVTGISTTPSGRSVNVKVFNPSGTQVASASPTSSTTINLTNLAAGTYSVLVTPSNAAKANLTLEID